MNKKVKIGLACLFLLDIFVVFVIGGFTNPSFDLKVHVTLKSKETVQVSYTTEKDMTAETLKFTTFNNLDAGEHDLYVKVPYNIRYIRIDFDDFKNQEASINQLDLSVVNKSYDLLKENDKPFLINNMKNQDKHSWISSDIDPFVVYQTNTNHLYNFWLSTSTTRIIYAIGITVLVDIFLIILMKLLLKNKEVQSLLANRRTIFSLAKRDFQTKYAGSYLGIFWAFVQPIVTILLYWFVFEVGFKSAPTNGFPFVLWLISGLVPWFMFSDSITTVTNCLLEYNYLVKKVVFDIKMLPIVKIISALFVHAFFIGLSIVIFAFSGHMPTIYLVQVLYYLIAMIALVIAIGFATCAIIVFFRDLGQIVQIALQIGVWMTPIMWNISIIPAKLQAIFKFNPTYYIVDGYRDCFINHVWFWEKPGLTIYYWVVVCILLFIGLKIFKKLQNHFADVL